MSPPRRGSGAYHEPSAGARAIVVPGVRRVAERAALGSHDAESLPGGRLHHPPALEKLDALRAQRLEPLDLGFLVVGLDVDMHAALVAHGLHEQDGFLASRAQLSIRRRLGVVLLDVSS